jgi:hypothetical protein
MPRKEFNPEEAVAAQMDALLRNDSPWLDPVRLWVHAHFMKGQHISHRMIKGILTWQLLAGPTTASRQCMSLAGISEEWSVPGTLGTPKICTILITSWCVPSDCY